MKELLSETITLLCKNGLQFESEFSIEALVGITLDRNEVILLNINETVRLGTAAGTSTSIATRQAVAASENLAKQNKCKRRRAARDEGLRYGNPAQRCAGLTDAQWRPHTNHPATIRGGTMEDFSAEDLEAQHLVEMLTTSDGGGDRQKGGALTLPMEEEEEIRRVLSTLDTDQSGDVARTVPSGDNVQKGTDAMRSPAMMPSRNHQSTMSSVPATWHEITPSGYSSGAQSYSGTTPIYSGTPIGYSEMFPKFSVVNRQKKASNIKRIKKVIPFDGLMHIKIITIKLKIKLD